MKPLAPLPAMLLLAGLGLSGCDGRAGNDGAPLLVFGRTGMGPGEFSYPRAAVRSPEGNVYIVDKAARIQCYTPAGEFLRDWRTPEKMAGKPTGLGIDRSRQRLRRRHALQPRADLRCAGHIAAEIRHVRRRSRRVCLPTDVAVAPDGSIYVSEYSVQDRISKFSSAGEYLFSFGGADAGEARLRRPQSLLMGQDGTLWVADACNHRICHFDSDGKLLATFGSPGSDLGQMRFPYGLDRLSDGSLVVTEYGNNRLQRFSANGRSLGTWGAAGRAVGELAYPWTAVVLPDDRVVVVDSGNNRVQVIDGAASATWHPRSGRGPHRP